MHKAEDALGNNQSLTCMLRMDCCGQFYHLSGRISVYLEEEK